MLAGILALAALLRLGAVAVIASPLESDYLTYWQVAISLHEGRGITFDGRPTAHPSLGYPLFLWGVFALLGPTIAAAKAANVVLGVAAIGLFYSGARRLFGRPFAAAAAAALLAGYPEAIAYTAYLAKENLMIFLLAAQFALVSLPQASRLGILNPILFGIATGAMAMAGNAALSLLPGLLYAAFLMRRRLRPVAGYAGIAAVAAMLTVTPLLVRNHQAFGAYILNNNGGFNLYIGNNPRATPYFQNISDTPIGDRWHALLDQLGERGVDVMLRDLAVEHMMQNPSATLELAARKAIAFWWPPVHAGRTVENAIERAVRLAWLVSFCGLVALFLLGATRIRAFGPRLAVLWLMLLGYTAVHTLFYVVYRYRLPIMPILCIGAGLGLQWLVSRLGWLPPAHPVAAARVPDAARPEVP